MQTQYDLIKAVNRIDGKGYKAYKELVGTYRYEAFTLHLDHVQGDPFAAPSRLRLRLRNAFPEWAFANEYRAVAFRDFLLRQVARSIGEQAKGHRGSGRSGAIIIDVPGPEVLDRSAVLLEGKVLEIRFRVGLPAYGRRVAAREAAAIFSEELPAIVAGSLFFEAVDREALRRHVETVEDTEALRQQLPKQGLTAFVADGALLPRASGVDQRPLEGGIPFRSPATLRCELQLPNRTIAGMGIPWGITLIVGGGFHGKSTLLNALERGVYNHRPGDGREFVVADPSAVKIRAEDGRYVAGVDISPFINNLPQGKDTLRFTTANASGSTSQAANVMEALEAGAGALLIDEDTSATNFMIRDQRMQQLVPRAGEPITPYLERVRALYEQKGISSIIVVGGSGLYFDVADRVICMVEYLPHDLTVEARAIAAADPLPSSAAPAVDFGAVVPRRPAGDSLHPEKGGRPRLRSRGRRQVQFGETDIDLTAVEQLVDSSQVNAIADALLLVKKYSDGRTMPSVLDAVMEEIKAKGFDALGGFKSGEYAAFRRQELAAAVNRLRTLRVG